jgi:hypothetical protein
MYSDLSSLSDFEEASPRMRRRVQRRVRIRFIRNREDPFELLDDREFKQRFRLSKMTVANLLEEIGPAIEPKTNRNKSINARLQLMITLRFYATGAFQQLIGDYIHINQSNVSRIIKRVTLQLGRIIGMRRSGSRFRFGIGRWFCSRESFLWRCWLCFRYSFFWKV